MIGYPAPNGVIEGSVSGGNGCKGDEVYNNGVGKAIYQYQLGKATDELEEFAG